MIEGERESGRLKGRRVSCFLLFAVSDLISDGAS